ncbi:2-hydroxyacid dehydrogenase [Nitrospirillum viridazoti]|uniref:Lactate dehydrogenase-like 2-hydroxyacid dehydrogenase n=1 Tax=Nitrospirillum amazonense TaxID=28077 RepID=A0A560IEE1_9PROT|nr:2-hydroxyacid dehydrogenase [Nitrospirillum amazonense]TWB56665.1 lactate dehydrogenase-like 2-hydroxyacid dehydrogenase [Nitrospirillum amazonense]
MTPRFDIDLLMPAPMMPFIMERLGQAFHVHKLWLAADAQALLAEVAPRVRAIAAAGGAAITADLMRRLPRLECVSGFGVGYDSIDARWAGTHGITVTNTPDVLTEEVADTALALTLMAVRRLPQAERYLRAGRWLEKPFPLASSLRGRTAGILGLGRIGKAIARRFAACGVPVHYHGRHRQADMDLPYHATLVDLARAVDVLVVVTPGGAETRNLVDAAVLKALGPDGILVNIARGTVVDEQALVAALRDGTILGAGLDVFAHEPQVPQALLDLDNAVLLPHVGSATTHTRQAMGQLVVDNLVAWAQGRPVLTPVPETPIKAG